MDSNNLKIRSMMISLVDNKDLIIYISRPRICFNNYIIVTKAKGRNKSISPSQLGARKTEY